MTQERYGPRDWNSHPPFIHPPYKSTVLRGPTQRLVPLKQTLSELTGPVYGRESIDPLESDLTKNSRVNGEALGERIVVSGRILDEQGRPAGNTLVEVWQANAAGRYVDKNDQHDAPLDPNFLGVGRCVTDEDGRYRFTSIRPGAYPWGNHPNAWRPSHIHFSIFGPSLATRLVTQMYFPGDPLLALDPIFRASGDEEVRARLVSIFSLELTEPAFALGYAFDIVLRGRDATPMEL